MRHALLFQVDQGLFEGSMMANFGPGKPAQAALANIWASLQPLAAKYDLYVGFTPLHADWGGVVWPFFNMVKSLGARFFIDYCSSDNVMQSTRSPIRVPYLHPYAVSRSYQELVWLLNEHKGHFGGIRFHEYGFWYQWGFLEQRAGRLNVVSQEVMNRIPAEPQPFHLDMVEPIFANLKAGGHWACWSEPSMKPPTVDTIKHLTDKYPHVVVPTFANNVGNTVAQYWPIEIQPCITPNTLGWGLSVQSWRWSGDTGYLPGGYPPEYWDWVRSSKGAVITEFEPGWLHWNIPGVKNGGWEPWGPQHDGRPTPMLQPLIDCLMTM